MDRISRNFTIGRNNGVLSCEQVHKNFKMNMMFLYLTEVHISSICDSDVLYDVFKFYLTEQAFIWEQRPKLQKGEWRWSFRDRWSFHAGMKIEW